MDLPKLSGRQFADLLGVSPASVTNWINDGMPATRSGRQGREVQIDLASALPWVVNHRESPPGSQRERLAKAQAEKVELENEIKRGNLIWRWQVQECFQAMAADISARLDGLPGRAAGELAGMTDAGEIRERLQDECRSIRSGHAEYIGKLAVTESDSEGDGEDVSPAAEENPERVGGPEPDSAAGKRRTRAVAK